MSGFKQELGLGQELGCFPPHCWVRRLAVRRWRRWSLAITACGHGRAHSPVSRLPSSSPCWAAIFPARAAWPICRYGLWATSASVTGWLFLSVIPVGLPPPCTSPPVLAGAVRWHDAQLLADWAPRPSSGGSVRVAPAPARLQTLVAVLIVALIVVVWWRGGISPRRSPSRPRREIDRRQLFRRCR